MSTNNLFNVPSWTSIRELFFRRLGINLDPNVVSFSFTGAIPTPINNVVAATGDGTKNHYTLTVDGVVPSSVTVTSLIRQDANGAQYALSATPRSNYVLWTDNQMNAPWDTNFATVAASEETTDDGYPYWSITSPSFGSQFSLNQQIRIATIQPGETWTASAVFRAGSNNNQGGILINSQDSAFLSVFPIDAEVVSGPGTVTISSNQGSIPGGPGSSCVVSGLSTTEDTLVQLHVQSLAQTALRLNFAVATGNMSSPSNFSTEVLVARPMLEKGAMMGTYISNQGTVLSVADYTVNGANVTLSSNLPDGSELIWTGSAVLPAKITLTANPTAPDGSKGPYVGSVSYYLTQLQVTNELPALLVWSGDFPMTVDALADYLMSSYGYYMEDGEFIIAGDPNATPLVRGGGMVYNGYNPLTQQFRLQATPNAVRWKPGATVTVQVASSNSIVPANGFAITSGQPPAGALGASYDYIYQVTNGTPPYTYTVVQGTPPVPVNPITGEMKSNALTTTGSFSWIIQVTDSVGRVVTRLDQMVVAELPLTFSPPTLNPNVSTGVAMSLNLGVSGGRPPYIYSVYLGQLPPTVSISNGAIVGTWEGNTAAGSNTLSNIVGVQVTDQDGTTLQRILNFTITDRTATQIQASLNAKVLHWFERSTNVYTGGISTGVGDVLFDCTGRANLEIAAAPGFDDSVVIGTSSGFGNQPYTFGLGSGAYAHNNTVAFNLPNDFAIMALINYTSASATKAGQALIGRGADAHGGYELKVGPDNTSLELDLVMSNTPTQTQFPTQIAPGFGNYYHCIAQMFDNVPELVMNAGIPVDMPALTGTLTPNMTEALFLGIDPALDLATLFQGSLGMIAIFTEKLWSDERKWLYNTGSLQNFPALGYWDELVVTGPNYSGTALVGEEISYAFTISGGSGTYVNAGSLITGSMPPGMSASYDGVSTITISGVPNTQGFYSFGVQVASTDGQFASGSIGVTFQYAGQALISLPLHGTNGQTTVTDSTGRHWTVNGNAAISTAVDGSGAMYFDGTNSYLSTPLTNDFNLAGIPFTMQVDVYPQTNSAYMLSTTVAAEMPGAMGLDAAIGSPGDATGLYPFWGWYSNTAWNAARAQTPATQNSWNTVKGFYDTVRNEIALFLNGQVVGFTTPSEPESSIVQGQSIWLGRRWDSSGTNAYFQGYMRNLAVSTGVTYDTLSVLEAVFPDTSIGEAYSSSLPILGGSGHYSDLTIVSGALPSGLSLTLGVNTLILSGTVGNQDGTFTFRASFQSSDGQTFTNDYSVTVQTIVFRVTTDGEQRITTTGLDRIEAIP